MTAQRNNPLKIFNNYDAGDVSNRAASDVTERNILTGKTKEYQHKAYIRKSKKISQIRLAEMTDMNFNYIGQIERGQANVTINTVIKIADALDIEIKELFDFTL